MTSHANCTHEKSKAARAACRAGKAPISSPTEAKATRDDAATRLREKATKATKGRLSEARCHTGDQPSRASKAYMSGHCSIDNHDACRGIYALTPCTCTCHPDTDA